MINQNQLTIFFLTTLICSGCIYTPIDIPPIPSQPVCQKVEPVICPKLDAPDPIPFDVFINIKDGKVVDIDKGGEQLIRNYAATRKYIIKRLP